MSENDLKTTEAPTRRDYMKYGSAVVGGSLLAGCAGQSDSGSTPTETEADESPNTKTGTSTPQDESHSVTMSPMGTVEFESVPESVAVYDTQWVDHLVALGHGDKVNSLGTPDQQYQGYYDQLPGVSFDTSDLAALWTNGSLDKEMFFELDSDIHHLDPVRVAFMDGWDESDVEEIQQNIGPWFANRYSRENSLKGIDGEYEGDYEFYSLWELTEKFAQVYQEPERAAALKRIQQELVETVQSQLPPESERPTVGLIWWADGEFIPYELLRPGFAQSNYRIVEPRDAFAETETTYTSGGSVDYETMLEVDPDVLIFHFGVDWASSYQKFVDTVPKHPVGSELSAVENERLYQGGTAFQGPLFQLFQIEMAAKQIYPDTFGEWPGFDEDVRYEIPEDEQLFDRQRVADIINGDI